MSLLFLHDLYIYISHSAFCVRMTAQFSLWCSAVTAIPAQMGQKSINWLYWQHGCSIVYQNLCQFETTVILHRTQYKVSASIVFHI